MRRIPLHMNMPVNLVGEFVKSFQAGEAWVENIDTTSKYYGTIGLLDPSATLAVMPTRPGRVPITSCYNTFWVTSNPLDTGKKQLKICPNNVQLVWLDGYDEEGVYSYNSNLLEVEVPELDFLGNEIVKDAYVVAGSGQGQLQFGRVLRVYKKKTYSRIETRVEIAIISSHMINEASENPNPYNQNLPKTATTGVKNLLVITPDIKQQAMIQKLSRV